ncbi:hypothetical protein FISHEDRAFT_77544 [Fistulina hepatica ATCC 64428]|uniref:DH domain-containing protein n=1 Tax=Fistulina hepatica ATCC 64428 TaxID=1128425 RepID=A0A0D7A369_9AGAR|nr:hypothetical protein FISHEDRAFT_77544 [Fistulina hepatica ATCC 64428]
MVTPQKPPRSPLRPTMPTRPMTPPPDSAEDDLASRKEVKRDHALTELLTSERAYASDLVLVRDVYIPRALDPCDKGDFLPTPPSSRANSAVANDGATAMNERDARIIFMNIADLAELADAFSQRIQIAVRRDCVGKLFCDAMPLLEGPYSKYISGHDASAKHFASFAASPAYAQYVSDTQSIATGWTTAWDLPSLLIKPVQRFLKYPLLLSTLISCTPPDHPDLPDLVKAKALVEEMAARINEVKRRKELVQEALASDHKCSPVKLPLRRRSSARRSSYEEEHPDVVVIRESKRDLSRMITFAKELSNSFTAYGLALTARHRALVEWSFTFANVVSIPTEGYTSPDSSSFSAYLDVLASFYEESTQLHVDKVLRPLTTLVAASTKPRGLIAKYEELAPVHHALLNTPVSSPSSASMIKSSQMYVALRTTLAKELPLFNQLLRRSIDCCVLEAIHIEQTYWRGLRDRWTQLLIALESMTDVAGDNDHIVENWFAKWEPVGCMFGRLVESGTELLRRTKSGRSHRPPSYKQLQNSYASQTDYDPPAYIESVTGAATVQLVDTRSRGDTADPHDHISVNYVTKRRSSVHSLKSRALGPSSEPASTSPPRIRLGRPSTSSSQSSYYPRSWTSSTADDSLAPPSPDQFSFVSQERDDSASIVTRISSRGKTKVRPPPLSGEAFQIPSTSPLRVKDKGKLKRDTLGRSDESTMPRSPSPLDISGIFGKTKKSHNSGGSMLSSGSPSPRRAFFRRPGSSKGLPQVESSSPLESKSMGNLRARHDAKEMRRRGSETLIAAREDRSVLRVAGGGYEVMAVDRYVPVPKTQSTSQRLSAHLGLSHLSYLSHPVKSLSPGDLFVVLADVGSPEEHPSYPAFVDGGVDRLLLLKFVTRTDGSFLYDTESSERVSSVGWGLASYFIPVEC